MIMTNNLGLAGIRTKLLRFMGTLIILVITGSSIATSIPALNLRSLEDFVILAGSTVTGIPPVAIKGNVGLSPAAGSFIVGFDGSNVDGILYVVDDTGPAGSVKNATLLQTAKSDLTTAYNDAAGRTPVPTGDFLNPGDGNMGGLSLVAGLYKFTSSAAITGADLTLTGSSSDVWIFQIATSFNIGSGIKIILAGSAQAKNIFWQVGTSATIGTYATLKGTVLADQSVTLGTGASMDGRALAFSASVTMASGVTTNLPDEEVQNPPIFSVNPTSLDFGNVSNGQTKMDSVTVINKGGENLIISNVTSTNALFTVTPKNGTIAPGDSIKYYITFAPLSSSIRTASIIFNHNDAGLKDTVSVSGSSSSAIFTSKPSTLFFGKINTGSQKVDSITVTNMGTSNLIISNVTSSNELFTVNSSSGTLSPGQSKSFAVTFSPLTDGLKSGYIYFTHNASGLKDSVRVVGTGGTQSTNPVFAVNTSNISFGSVLVNEEKQRKVIISNTGDDDLIISSIFSGNNQYTVSSSGGTIAPGSTMEVIITFTPTSEGLKSGYIYFMHNAANESDSVRVSGTGRIEGTNPEFTINTSYLDFGTVLVGTQKQLSVTVTNTGDADLIFSDLFSDDYQYIISPTGGTIPPNGTLTFHITFAPNVVGQVDALIQFTHNAGIDIINVTGIGEFVISISEAKALPAGTEFAIEGIVTRTLGKYTRIQDETGGITIFQSSGDFHYDVATNEIRMRDRIRVQGRTSEMNHLTVINGDDLTGYEVISPSNPMPTPIKVTLQDIMQNGEMYESRLITVVDLTLPNVGGNTFNAGTLYQVTDPSENSNGVTISIGSNEDTHMVGQPFLESAIFVGVLGQSSMNSPYNGYQLFPVLQTDLIFSETSVMDNEYSRNFTLSNNYPNPFTNTTTIQYSLVNADYVKMNITDMLGNVVATVVDGYQTAGTHTVTFSTNEKATKLASGVYYYTLFSDKFSLVRSFVIVE
ncbi:MAG: choice-of-anchor D domain-containing protein [Desulfobulbaceae bacterium]|nr:choice-of-anchor D domain-containing protein [Candidatus Kapabacteria bacterium]MBS3998910.1 choice-of-anchor D domain-containing protein [Desulfobulbaceae bacterium]